MKDGMNREINNILADLKMTVGDIQVMIDVASRRLERISASLDAFVKSNEQ